MGKGTGWLVASRAQVVVQTPVYLTSFNDCLDSMNHFCHLIDVTPVWKMSSMIIYRELQENEVRCVSLAVGSLKLHLHVLWRYTRQCCCRLALICLISPAPYCNKYTALCLHFQVYFGSNKRLCTLLTFSGALTTTNTAVHYALCTFFQVLWQPQTLLYITLCVLFFRCSDNHKRRCTSRFVYFSRCSLATTNAIRTGSRGCICPRQRARLSAATWSASSATASIQPISRLSPRSCLAGPSSGGSWRPVRWVLFLFPVIMHSMTAGSLLVARVFSSCFQSLCTPWPQVVC